MGTGLKQKLKKGCCYGTMLSELYVPNIMRIFAACGFDFVIIDCEHGYFDYTETAALLAVARGTDMPAIIRISKVDREFVLKYLDMGAGGFLLSNTDDAGMISELVRHAKYPPMGRRGISLQRAHTDYNPGGITEYLKRANEETVILAEIESRRGVENVDEILSLDGVDGAVIGPNDLALDMGLLGHNDHPDVVAAYERVIASAQGHAKAAGLVSSSIDFHRRWRERGMSLFSWNSEIGMLLNEGKRGIAALKGADG